MIMKNRIRALRDFLEEIAATEIDFSHTPCPYFDPEESFSEDYRYFMQIIGKCEIGSSPIPGNGYQILNVDHPVAMNKADEAIRNQETNLWLWNSEPENEICGVPSDRVFLVANDCDNQAVWLLDRKQFFTDSTFNTRPSECGNVEIKSFFEWLKYYLETILEYKDTDPLLLNKIRGI